MSAATSLPLPDCDLPDFKEDLVDVMDALSTLRFFPKDESVISAVASVVISLCNTPDEARWLRKAVLLAWNDWPGPRDLRALFCQNFRPRDGVEVSLERPTARFFNSEEVGRLRALPYSEYLESDHWRILRTEKMRDAGYRCQLCNNGGALEVHHRTYENRGREPLSDLVVLCHDCHAHFHSNVQVAVG